eukprot:46783-Eustigmatos_ZCMA.PRE.1
MSWRDVVLMTCFLARRRFFYWADTQHLLSATNAHLELRISLLEMQAAIDASDKRHVISYAREFRIKRFGT